MSMVNMYSTNFTAGCNVEGNRLLLSLFQQRTQPRTQPEPQPQPQSQRDVPRNFFVKGNGTSTPTPLPPTPDRLKNRSYIIL